MTIFVGYFFIFGFTLITTKKAYYRVTLFRNIYICSLKITSRKFRLSLALLYYNRLPLGIDEL